MGIAWANENGCYFYDGQKVHNLTDGKIKETDWQTHIGDSTDVIFFPLKKKILVTSGSGNIYTFSFITTSWSYSKSKVDTTKTNFIADIDNDIKFMSGAGLVKKWDDSTSAGDVEILTKDFDFGNPSVRKKCYKFYVTYKSNGVSNLKVYYGTNGQDLTAANATGDAFSTASKFAGTSTVCYGSDGLITTGGAWKQAELVPTSSINNIYSIQFHFKSSNIVANGTFDTNTTGWDADGTATLSLSNGKLVITSGTSGGQAALGRAKFTLTTVVGQEYTVKGNFYKGTSDQGRVEVGTGSVGNYISRTDNMTVDTEFNFTFTATATSHILMLHENSQQTVGDTTLWDNIVVTGEVPADFEINDMTVIYREKPLK